LRRSLPPAVNTLLAVALVAGALALVFTGYRDSASVAPPFLHDPARAEHDPPRASIWRVVDGDTVELVFDDGDGEADEDEFEKVRVRGIDTPEKHASSKLDRHAEHSALDRETIRTLGKAATAHAESLLPLGTVVIVEGDDRDRYGRLVAYLLVEDAAGQPFDFGGRMIADGYAHAYDGGGRYPHERMDYYRALQRAAREQARGLWATDGTATARLSP
jgi:micrococcal nuclease